MSTREPVVPDLESAPPALFDHACKVYRTMLSESTKVEREGQELIVYEGFLTKLVTEKLALSVPYYTSLREALMRMGCIRQLKRGGGTAPSQWELIYEPTLDAFMRAPLKKTQTRAGRVSTARAQQDQIMALNSRVSKLESQVHGLLEFLSEQFGKETA